MQQVAEISNFASHASFLLNNGTCKMKNYCVVPVRLYITYL
jgi:hypothetical protein